MGGVCVCRVFGVCGVGVIDGVGECLWVQVS